MDTAGMDDDWLARNMPGNIRTAEPAESRGTVTQFPLDVLYPTPASQAHNGTFDIQQLVRLNQNAPTSQVQPDSPTNMLFRLLGLLPGNPGSTDVAAGALDNNSGAKRPGLVDNISNGQLQSIQDLLRTQPQQNLSQMGASKTLGLMQFPGNGLNIRDLDALTRNASLASTLQQQVAQLQQQPASNSKSKSRINVLSLLDPASKSKQEQSPGHAADGTGVEPSTSEFMPDHELLNSGGTPVLDSQINAWNPIKQEGLHLDAPIPPAKSTDGQQDPTAPSPVDKNMQDLVESVQRHNPQDSRGWQNVAMDVNVDVQKWHELKQCYDNFSSIHASSPPQYPSSTPGRQRGDSPRARRTPARPANPDHNGTPNKHGRRINPRKGIPMHIMATYALLRLPEHEGNLSDMSAKIEENAFFCKQLDWTPRPGTKTYPRWKDALVGCFKPGRYPHLKKTSRKKEGLTVYALVENVIPEKSCLKPSMLADVDPALLPADFDINNPLVPLRTLNVRASEQPGHNASSVITTGGQPALPMPHNCHAVDHVQMDSAALSDSAHHALNSLSTAFTGGLARLTSHGGDMNMLQQQGVDAALLVAAMQQHQHTS